MLIPCIKLYDENSFLDSLWEVPERVAIVGNSGNIIGSEKGSKIDSFNRVIRFNHATTKGFEKDVGSKTTDLAINCHVYNGYDLKNKSGFSEYRPDFWNQYNDNINVIYVNTNPPNKGRGVVPERLPFYILSHSAFHRTMVYPFKTDNRIPTVGYALIATLVTFGVKPTIFGFSTLNDNWDHYFEKRPGASASHDHNLEIYLLSKMIDKGLIIKG